MRPDTAYSQTPSRGSAQKKRWPHYLLLALTFATWIAVLSRPAGQTNQLEALLLVLATASSISALACQLPLQSVLFAAAITALIGGAVQGLSALTGLPFGPVSFGETSGPKLFHTVPWTLGLIWIVAVFNSRGVARLILRPWRPMQIYGFLLIGLTAILTLAFGLALEPFARLEHLWFWPPTKISYTWQGASPWYFCGLTLVTLIILAIITPFLIRKQPGNPGGTDFTPLALWLGALMVFTVTAVHAGLWTAVIMDTTLALVIATLSWRGAKW